MKKALAIILTLALIGSLSVFIYADAADTATVNDYTDATVVLDRDPTGEDGANPVAVWTEGPAITPTLVDFEGGKGIDLSVAAGNENEGAFKMFVYPQISDFTQQDVLRIRVKNNSDKEAYGLWLDFGSMQSAVNGCVTLINKDGSANSWSGQFWGCSPTLPANFDGYFVVDLTLMKGYSADALRNFTDRIKLQFMRGSTTMAGTSITVGSLAMVNRDSLVPAADKPSSILVQSYVGATVVTGRDPSGDEMNSNPVAVYTEGPAVTPTVVDFDGEKGIELAVASGNTDGNAFKMYIYHPGVTNFTQQKLLRIRVKNSSDKEAYGLWMQFGSMHSSVSGCVTLINKDGSTNDWSGKFWGSSPTLPANFDGYFLVDLTKLYDYSADTLRNFTGRISLQFMKGDGPVMADASITVGNAVLVSADAIIPAEEESSEESQEPEQSEPEQSEPEQSEPEQSEPEQSEPEQSEPEQSEPEQSEPAGDMTGDPVLVQKFDDAAIIEGRDPSDDEWDGNPVAVYTEGPAVTSTIVDLDDGKGINLAIAAGNKNENAFKMYVYHPGVTDLTVKPLLRIRIRNNSSEEAYGLWLQLEDMQSNAAGCVKLFNKDGSANDWAGQFWGASPTLPAGFDGYAVVDMAKLVNYSENALKNFTGRINLQFVKGEGPVMSGSSVTVGDMVLVDKDNIVPVVPVNPETGIPMNATLFIVVILAAGIAALSVCRKHYAG